MKHLKKIMSLILTAIMVIAMCVPVMATEGTTTYSLTIKGDKANHTYTAYQIFSGKLHVEGNDKILSDIAWGNGVSADAQTALGTAKDIAKELTDGTRTAKALAKTLIDNSGYLGRVAGTVTDSNLDSEGKFVYVIDGLTPGYYLVTDASTSGQTDDAISDYIVQIVGNATVAAKVAKPSVDKQVWDETSDAEERHDNGWGESADHAINETFQFKLKATLPVNDNYDSYTSYMVKFNDTMSAGVTFESIDSVKITCGGKTYTIDKGTDKNNEPGKYFAEGINGENKAGLTWSLEIPNLKAVSNEINLKVGATIEVIYNAHLNENAIVSNAEGTGINTNNNKVDLEYSNNPNGTGTGKTEEDYVWVFTYKVDNTKVNGSETNKDGTHPVLAGAKFKLYDSNGVNEIGLIYDTEKSAYRPIKSGENATEMVSGADGKFNIIGLDAGTYTLRETEAPSGFNKCADITIVISAKHNENVTTGADLKFTNSSQNMANTIEDKKGSTLPETGGIGTTIFYVVGVVLMLGAGVLLITKRRMSAKH